LPGAVISGLKGSAHVLFEIDGICEFDIVSFDQNLLDILDKAAGVVRDPAVDSRCRQI